MKNFLLTRVRLTAYYPLFFFIFLVIIFSTPKLQLTGSQLTLFSVNSFLFAFYLGPIMNSQKQRLDDLAKVIRNEAIAFFSVSIQAHDMTLQQKHEVRAMGKKYLQACLRTRNATAGEHEYESLLRYCIDQDNKNEHVKKAQQILIDNQQNRSQLSALLQQNVYSHEWFVLFVLSVITLSYIVIIDYGQNWLLNIVAALLCTGLAMLLMILQKLNTLTHKKAKTIWKPFDKLLDTDFKRID